jgi:hypothetical protein
LTPTGCFVCIPTGWAITIWVRSLLNGLFVEEPIFVASFEVDDYVLFFLREKSVEQIAENQDVYYSRVIRVCKVSVPKAQLLDG